MIPTPLMCCAVALTAFACGCGSSAAPPAPPAANYLPQPGSATGTTLKVGDPFPELRTIDLDGNELVLGPELLGERATLIVFWSTWCGYCMQELPHEIALSREYAPAGLRVLGVNADDTPDVARQAVQEHGIPWLNVFEGPERTISDELGISFWPTLFLLDADGRIISATPYLRGTAIETLADGTTREVNVLDWTLEDALRPND